MTDFACQCIMDSVKCNREATQEDMKCDACRELRCCVLYITYEEPRHGYWVQIPRSGEDGNPAA
jgi:hypothetical protein